MKYVLSSDLEKYTFITLGKAGFKFRVLGLLGVQPCTWQGELSWPHATADLAPRPDTPAWKGASSHKVDTAGYASTCCSQMSPLRSQAKHTGGTAHPQEDGPQGRYLCTFWKQDQGIWPKNSVSHVPRAWSRMEGVDSGWAHPLAL